MNLVFLVSGNGGNLKFFNKCIEKGFIHNCKLIVIADRNCGALKYSKDKEIENYLINYDIKNNGELMELLDSVSADIIITNIHKILDKEIVDKYNGKMINIHYSLLPAYSGLIGEKPVVEAMKYAKFIGATTHYVERDVDAGKTIIQGIIKNTGNKNEIMNKIFRIGCILLLYSVFLIYPNVNRINFNEISDEKEYIFSPDIMFNIDIFDENFWDELRN